MEVECWNCKKWLDRYSNRLQAKFEIVLEESLPVASLRYLYWWEQN